jgi:hypothetical protein
LTSFSSTVDRIKWSNPIQQTSRATNTIFRSAPGLISGFIGHSPWCWIVLVLCCGSSIYNASWNQRTAAPDLVESHGRTVAPDRRSIADARVEQSRDVSYICPSIVLLIRLSRMERKRNAVKPVEFKQASTSLHAMDN